MEFNEFYMVGSKEEVNGFERVVDFGKDKLEIKFKYEKLGQQYKDCVICLINNLNGEKDFFGYNLGQFLKGLQNAEPGVPTRKIEQVLIQTAPYYGVDIWVDQNEIKKDQKHAKTKYLDKCFERAKQLYSINEKNIDTYKFIQEVCANFLCSIELFNNGIGKIWEINDPYFEDYCKDNHEFWKLVNENPDKTWNTQLCVKFYENYLRKKGKLIPNQPVLIERWAVITHSGMYQKLKSRAGESTERQKAVDMLIENLYNIELANAQIIKMYTMIPCKNDIE